MASVTAMIPLRSNSTSPVVQSCSCSELKGNRVDPAPAPWVAAPQPLETEQRAAPSTVRLDCLKKVLRTGRLEAAGASRPRQQRQQRRQDKLISANEDSE